MRAIQLAIAYERPSSCDLRRDEPDQHRWRVQRQAQSQREQSKQHHPLPCRRSEKAPRQRGHAGHAAAHLRQRKHAVRNCDARPAPDRCQPYPPVARPRKGDQSGKSCCNQLRNQYPLRQMAAGGERITHAEISRLRRVGTCAAGGPVKINGSIGWLFRASQAFGREIVMDRCNIY